jgi:hypothetical protein
MNKLPFIDLLMNRYKHIFILIILLAACKPMQKQERTTYFPKQDIHVVNVPKKEETLVFILAGQSNMAGRGLVEPKDTIPSDRVLSINQQGALILAKEPLHFYEPTRRGLDCGLSFAKALLKSLPTNITILLVPTAIGGSSLRQWMNDSTYRSVQLLTNFKQKVALGKMYGTIAGVLWHQGESEANATNISLFTNNLSTLFTSFRSIIGNAELPILMGELGQFEPNAKNKMIINQLLLEFKNKDPFTALVSSKNLQCMSDSVHFTASSQRLLGKRYAKEFLSINGKHEKSK